MRLNNFVEGSANVFGQGSWIAIVVYDIIGSGTLGVKWQL